jgi:hypothetical protein
MMSPEGPECGGNVKLSYPNGSRDFTGHDAIPADFQ